MICFSILFQNSAVPEEKPRRCAEGAAFGRFNSDGEYEGGPVVVWWYGYGRKASVIYNYRDWQQMTTAVEQVGMIIRLIGGIEIVHGEETENDNRNNPAEAA